MADIDEFRALIERVRAGDEEAATEFVRQYEPAIRRAARIRLVDPRLSPLVDSGDIVQSVFTSFFVRAALGEYDLDQPKQVLNLLLSMSKRKMAHFVRTQSAARRDYRRTKGSDTEGDRLPSSDPDPGQHAATLELVQEFRKRLTPDERELAELRAQGQNWGEIAAARGQSSEALRKKLGRAVSRIAQDLGLDEDNDE